MRGDVVGVIGRNGAGKSTLLKILTRVTRPTIGSLRGWGRVGSLLELGTGFHPELTGRENVFLSGAVLGMRRAEIVRKFDRIVEFSGIEHMLDTPVKRYSSGMYVRLGFSVAAHLEPDILVLDEVLAVGDAPFQGRCLERRRLSQEGTTVLLVSHNLNTVTSFCRSGLLLEQGRVTAQGAVSEVARTYTRSLEAAAGQTLDERRDRAGEGRVRVVSVLTAKNTYWATEVEIQQLAVAGWIASTQGKQDDALKLMRAAADLEDTNEKHIVTPGRIVPARELLGDMLLEMKQPALALKEYEASHLREPNRFLAASTVRHARPKLQANARRRRSTRKSSSSECTATRPDPSLRVRAHTSLCGKAFGTPAGTIYASAADACSAKRHPRFGAPFRRDRACSSRSDFPCTERRLTALLAHHPGWHPR